MTRQNLIRVPHDTKHIFNCSENPTELEPIDLWTRPKKVAEYLFPPGDRGIYYTFRSFFSPPPTFRTSFFFPDAPGGAKPLPAAGGLQGGAVAPPAKIFEFFNPYRCVFKPFLSPFSPFSLSPFPFFFIFFPPHPQFSFFFPSSHFYSPPPTTIVFCKIYTPELNVKS